MDAEWIATVGELRKALRTAPEVLVNSNTLWGATVRVSRAEVLRMIKGMDGSDLLDTDALVFADGVVSI